MYLAVLKIPSSVSEFDLERLGPALDGLNVGYYASKEIEGDESSPWLMRWIVEEQPDFTNFSIRLNIWADAQEIDFSCANADWTLEKIDEETDWLAESYQGFQPFTLSQFFIYGSHYTGELPSDYIPLQIDAATAFGSGEHPTTAGCLEMLYELKDSGWAPTSVLDMGCGSGILAIAAKKIWPDAAMTAIDIDPESIAVTKRHVTMNGLAADCMDTAAGNGFETDLAQDNAPYDLIIANILAGPLKAMAGDLERCLPQNNGRILLSGLLNEQADEILTAYAAQGLTKSDHKIIGEWSTLLLAR